ncbi:MAG: ASCH domain-containing protein [Bacilli bacterium]
MVIHNMNLWNDSFEAIRLKTKTIEMRLNDEKRRLINVGDLIEFTDKQTNEKLKCLVINIYKYQDFYELYKHHDKISIGYSRNEIARPEDMLEYYTANEIYKDGVLAIELKLFDESIIKKVVSGKN